MDMTLIMNTPIAYHDAIMSLQCCNHKGMTDYAGPIPI